MDLTLPPLSQRPEHREAAARIAELEAARNKLRGRIREIEIQLSAHVPEAEKTSGHVDAALEFLRTGVATPSGNYIANLRDEHVTLRQQLEAVEKVHAQRSRELMNLEGTLSGEATAQAQTAHDDVCARFAVALRELDAVIAEEAALVTSIERLGYSPRFTRRVVDPRLGSISDPSSLLWCLARDFPLPDAETGSKSRNAQAITRARVETTQSTTSRGGLLSTLRNR